MSGKKKTPSGEDCGKVLCIRRLPSGPAGGKMTLKGTQSGMKNGMVRHEDH
jgi:hypothetical protein